MEPIRIANDIVPMAEFKTHTARVFRQLRSTGRPVVITQNGRPAGVLVSAEDYDRLASRERLVEAVGSGLRDASDGRAVDDPADLVQLLDARAAEP